MVCLCPFVRTKGRVIAGQGNKRRLALLLYFLRQSQTTGNRLYFYFLVRQFYLMVFSVDQWKPARFSMNLGGIIKQSCEAEVGMIETKMDKYLSLYLYLCLSLCLSLCTLDNLALE